MRAITVGDKVRVIDPDYKIRRMRVYNFTGTILDRESDGSVLVEFDRFVDGHDEGNRKGHCWWIDSMYLGFLDSFRIGDRVEVISKSDVDGRLLHGLQGKIINVSEGNKQSVLVEFDYYIKGHDGRWSEIKGKKGHCWWINKKFIRLIGFPETNIINRLKDKYNSMYNIK